MGTRGLWGFVIDGSEKLTYNHLDSYPAGLGLDILQFLRGQEVASLRTSAAGLRVVSQYEPPTEAEQRELRRFADTMVSSRDLGEWYVLLRRTQGDPEQTLEAGRIVDAAGFALDSWCEWGYVIDLDAGRFDVYEGYRQGPPTDGRWVGKAGRESGSYPIQRVASWPLDVLPTDDDLLAVEGGGL